MQGLGDRLGILFAQLPPNYGPAEFEDLAAFLQACPTDVRLAVELRHLDWFQPAHAMRLNQLLTDLGMGRVLLDTRPIYDCPDDPQLTSERRKPRLPLQTVTTARFNFVRYISHPELSRVIQSYPAINPICKFGLGKSCNGSSKASRFIFLCIARLSNIRLASPASFSSS
jgi:uncharacterized protein YecE (DUF72 family)